MFLFQRRSSTLFVITRSSSLLRVSVDIKNNVEKESTLLFCFLSKSPVGHKISRQKHLELSVVSYLLTGLFYIGMPVVRTDGRSVGRAYGHAITKISRMDGWAIPHLFERLFLISWENNRDCHITMPLSLKKWKCRLKGTSEIRGLQRCRSTGMDYQIFVGVGLRSRAAGALISYVGRRH